MSEKRLSKKFKELWLKEGNPFFKRLEPKACSEGIPDCWTVNKRMKDFFFELKFMNKKFKECKLPIKQSQIHFFLKYPGNLFFLFQIDKTYYLFRKFTQDKNKQIINVTLEFFKKIKWERFEELAIVKTNDLLEICKKFN